MVLKILYGVLITVLIIWFCSLCFEKISNILDEKDFHEMIVDYVSNLQDFINLKEKLAEYENKFNELSKRLTEFETDFKTYDNLLENRLTDIEQVIKDWKDTMASAVTCEHGCTKCKSDDPKKSHPKTKPKTKSQTDIVKEQLAEKGMKI